MDCGVAMLCCAVAITLPPLVVRGEGEGLFLWLVVGEMITLWLYTSLVVDVE